MNVARRSVRIIHSTAPIRICDNGGWTDTWFARHGAIFNIGVTPCAEAEIEVFATADDASEAGRKTADGLDTDPHPANASPEGAMRARPAAGHQADRPLTRHSPAGAGRIIIHAENYGERYAVQPETGTWLRHPLLEAAIERMRVPRELALQVTIFSEAPAGASTGTSAAVAVALVGALDCLTPGRLSAHEAAYTAHAIEVEMLQRQSGIQDQLCSAYGGINYIEMSAYPHASVSRLTVSNDIWWELERRLVLVYLGKSHDSSRIHEKVIRELEDAGPDCAQLNDLRRTAARSRDAVLAGDFAALGHAMCDNTEAQGRLHPELVGPDAARVIELARAHGAAGWKVNGAGGEGGSLTILAGPLSHRKRALIRDIEAESGRRNIPIQLSRHGLRVWEQPQS